MNKAERELLVQMIVNLDEVVQDLGREQRERVKPSLTKIYANYYNLMEGVKDHEDTH